MFSGHVETKILKFSPARATKVRLPGRGGREGRGGEGRAGKGKGREGRRRGGEGEEGRGEGMGCFYLGPPSSKCVATALGSHGHNFSRNGRIYFLPVRRRELIPSNISDHEYNNFSEFTKTSTNCLITQEKA